MVLYVLVIHVLSLDDDRTVVVTRLQGQVRENFVGQVVREAVGGLSLALDGHLAGTVVRYPDRIGLLLGIVFLGAGT